MNQQMKLDRSLVLDEVKRVIIDILNTNTAKVYLFGSWARTEEKRTSDIDIAVEFTRQTTESQTLLMLLRDALEESTIPYKVDVVHLNRADEAIVNKVRKEGILWIDPRNE